MIVMIPKYPGEAREEYEKRKASMLAALPSFTAAPNPHPRVPCIDEAYDPAIHLPPGDSIDFSGATPVYYRASDGAPFEV